MSRLLSFVDELLQDSSKLVDFITDPEGVEKSENLTKAERAVLRRVLVIAQRG